MTTDKDAETLANPEVIELVRDKLEELRKRLLDSTRRNPLININFRPNSAAVMRVVDELPDVLRHNLTSGTAMRLVPLPALEEELADEQSREFQEALFHARRDDETFLAELDKLDPSAQGVAEKEDRIERRLKDRVRAQLDLPERQTKEALSLSKHAISHGISPNFALPVPEDEHEDGRHTDTDIQTLMLPEKLSRTAKGILERGRSFERETGVNVLHAAFGILEWKSPGERDKYTSPLLSISVNASTLERTNNLSVQIFAQCFERTWLRHTLNNLRQQFPQQHICLLHENPRRHADLLSLLFYSRTTRRLISVNDFTSDIV